MASYADNGRGVAIGLSPTLFAVVADQSPLGIAEKTMAANVTYDRAECVQNFREAIRQAVSIFARGLVHITSDAQCGEFGKDLAQ
jgi:hypothetical protein